MLLPVNSGLLLLLITVFHLSFSSLRLCIMFLKLPLQTVSSICLLSVWLAFGM